MKRLIINIILLLCSCALFCQDVSESQAVKMARYYVKRIDSEKRPAYFDNPQITAHKAIRPERISNHGKAYMWLVPVDDGWVLLSSSLKTTPVLAHIQSFEKPVYDSMPPAAQELVDSYEDYIAYINEHETQYEVDSRWQEALDSEEDVSVNNRNVITEVGPLLTVHWAQSGGGSCYSSKIYNLYCPYANNAYNCNKAPAGCVAVAIAQIMWYWKWPYAAQIPQTIGGNDYILKFYDWSKMPVAINNSTNLDEVDMIAGFLRDCGYRLNMNYGQQGSSASDDSAVATLKAFGFSKSIQLRSKWNTSGWTDSLRTNIDNGQPVYYTGWSKLVGGKGHAFVVDGYRAGNNLPIYHINFGWRDSTYNAWYNIDDAYVNDTTHYEYRQKAIFGIRPDPKYCTDTTVTTVNSPKFCIAQAGTITFNGVQISNISDGRVYSSESVHLTNGTHISGSNIQLAIKPVPCTEPLERLYLTPHNSNEENMNPKQSPDKTVLTNIVPSHHSVRKILRDGQVLILRNGHTYTLTGMEVK